MPLTNTGKKILNNMKRKYGPGKAQRVFYASKNAGKITGVDRLHHPTVRRRFANRVKKP